MVTKKIRTEYMKKFRDPKWETFSKSYEDSVKYRLRRRLMEHAHRPWFWEGWDGVSDSSGWSTPRLSRSKVAPLSVVAAPSSEVRQKLSELKAGAPGSPPADGDPGEEETPAVEDAGADPPSDGLQAENGEKEGGGGSAAPAVPSEDTGTDNGPADSHSSDGEPSKPPPKRRHRRRAPRSEPARRHDQPPDEPKPQRAKSQPPSSGKDGRWSSGRLDWTNTEVDALAPMARKRSSDPDRRRRARSADLEKTRQAAVAPCDDRWVTEYMRCFSARLS